MTVPMTLEWVGDLDGHARLIDQTKLPGSLEYLVCEKMEEMIHAIQILAVRGAPAIGVAGAFGVVLGIRNATDENFKSELARVAEAVSTARPTAVNLSWAVKRMVKIAESVADQPVAAIKEALLKEAKIIHADDVKICKKLGEIGHVLIDSGDSVLTHCNAGGLATARYGTALSIMYSAKEAGKKFEVYADETRPLLQGARLTTWELMQAGIDVTLITDNMAGHAMKKEKVNKVVVGADRIAANGDVANKIGTFSVAVLAKAHGIPFYVVAPTSTFDMEIASGDEIPIEERDPSEVAESFGAMVAPPNVSVFNPAFDVTPASYVAGIVTEKGIIYNPTTEKVRAIVLG